ncbi:uncharacterized protein LOC141532067 [Cotesia typhae]|uniref:uncharacterized protein LOC141532067 n=1 Tax=Cotesia typhae TaxID=2053667 RepID=UPI003D680928
MHHRVDLPEKYEANCILKKPDKILAIRISMMLGILIAGLMMGRRRYVSVESAVQVLKKYIKYFVPDLPPWSSEIWQIISNELENKWSSDCVRVNVRQDRKKILTIARQECGYFSENSKKSDVNDNYDDDLNRDNLNESIGSDSDNDDDEMTKIMSPKTGMFMILMKLKILMWRFLEKHGIKL